MGWETEIPDVVAGQPVESSWGNRVRDQIVHLVPTVAALPSDEPDGGMAYVQDIDRLYLRRLGAWVIVGPGALGLIGFGSGPAIAVDYTGVSTIAGCSITATTELGRAYEVAAFFTGAQVVNAAAPLVRMAGTAGLTNILWFQSVAAGASVNGDTAALHIPTSTASRTFTLTGQSTASALRLQPQSAQIWLKDIGPA